MTHSDIKVGSTFIINQNAMPQQHRLSLPALATTVWPATGLARLVLGILWRLVCDRLAVVMSWMVRWLAGSVLRWRHQLLWRVRGRRLITGGVILRLILVLLCTGVSSDAGIIRTSHVTSVALVERWHRRRWIWTGCRWVWLSRLLIGRRRLIGHLPVALASRWRACMLVALGVAWQSMMGSRRAVARRCRGRRSLSMLCAMCVSRGRLRQTLERRSDWILWCIARLCLNKQQQRRSAKLLPANQLNVIN